jgi:hypothetical protein
VGIGSLVFWASGADDMLEQQKRLLRHSVIGFRGPAPMRVDDRRRVTVRVADKALEVSVSNVPRTGTVTVRPRWSVPSCAPR